MTPKEIDYSLTQYDNRISVIQSEIDRLEKVRENIITSCPPDVLPHAEPLLTALIHGRKDNVPILSPRLAPIRHAIAPLMGTTNIETLNHTPVKATTGGWDGKGTLELRSMIEELEARKVLLFSSLPQDEEIASAQQELLTLTSELSAKETEYASVWGNLLSFLESTAHTAERFRLSTPDTRALRRRMNTLIETYDLPVPSILTSEMKHNLSPHDKRAVSFAWNLARFILSSLRDSGAINVLEVTAADTLDSIYAPVESDVERETLTVSLEKARVTLRRAESSLTSTTETVNSFLSSIKTLEEKVNRESQGRNPDPEDLTNLNSLRAQIDAATRRQTNEKRRVKDAAYLVDSLSRKLSTLPAKVFRKRPEVVNGSTENPSK